MRFVSEIGKVFVHPFRADQMLSFAFEPSDSVEERDFDCSSLVEREEYELVNYNAELNGLWTFLDSVFESSLFVTLIATFLGSGEESDFSVTEVIAYELAWLKLRCSEGLDVERRVVFRGFEGLRIAFSTVL